MRRTRLARLLTLALFLALTTGSTARATDPPDVPWTDLLPPLAVKDPKPKRIPHCARPSVKCIDYEIKSLSAIRAKFRCDHRAVFATTYLTLTKVLRQELRKNPHLFRDPKWLYREDAEFADLYFRTIRNYAYRKPIAPAWQIAFDTARNDNDADGVQDMLLGINAHVQNDMPYMLAAVGLHDAKGRSHKPDHEAMNHVLDHAFARVVTTLGNQYDPFVNTATLNGNPFEGTFGVELVRGWREGVWRNAERLLNAQTKEQRAQVEHQIAQNAALWAQMIVSSPGGPPDYRATRDAYCRTHRRPGV
jgi:hypothetical protein